MGKARAGRHGKKKAKWTRVDHDRRFQREFLFAAKGWFGGAVMKAKKRRVLGFFCGLRVRAKLSVSNLFKIKSYHLLFVTDYDVKLSVSTEHSCTASNW